MRRTWSLSGTGGLAALLLLSIWPLPAAPREGDQPQAAAAWSRTLDAVVLKGYQLPLFDSVAGDELFAYAYAGGGWQQIPLQVDEVDATGVYTVENGLLDGNDELVFMAIDLGDAAALSDWIADADSRAYARYEVQVTNPLNPAEQGRAYIYRSATLAPSATDYVSWDAGTDRIVAGTYVVGLAPGVHPGVDSLELNGSGVDVLDRTKIRINATCRFLGIPIWTDTLTEEQLLTVVDMTPDVDGLVRVGGGTIDSSSWSYDSAYQIQAVMDISAFQPPDPCTSVDINWVRLSFDWLDPVSSGMAPTTYYDDNTPAGVAIDGSPDGVVSTPVNAWKQVSGGRGSLVQVADVTLGGGSVTNYYRDDQTVDAEDTGDQQSFGDAGFRIDAPTGQVRFDLALFILGPDQSNVGATYRSYHENPLETAIAAQSYEPPCAPAGVSLTWSPVPVYAGVETTFSATVSEGQPPFTYGWTFGDDASTASGNPVTHTFVLSGTFPVSLTVSNACSTTAPVVYNLLVSEPGSIHAVYLPIVVRD